MTTTTIVAAREKLDRINREVADWSRRFSAASTASAERDCACPSCRRKQMDAAVELVAEAEHVAHLAGMRS